MTEQLQNFGTTTLAEDLTSGETDVTVADGSVFPSSGDFRVNCEDELMLVTARTGNDLTVSRGAEGTAAAAHSTGAAIQMVLTAAALRTAFDLTVRDESGDVEDTAVTIIRFPDGTVVDNGTGDVSVREVPTGVIGAKRVASGTMSVPNNSFETVTCLDSTAFDTDGFVSGEGLTIPAGLGGKYIIGGHFGWSNNATGGRILELRVNGAAVARARLTATVTNHNHNAITVIDLVPGDAITLVVHQTSGSARTEPEAGSQSYGALWAIKLGTGSLGDAVGAKAYNSTTQSISNDTVTAVTFDTEEFDTDAIHSTSANTSRFTVPTGLGGKWLLTATVTFAANTTGRRFIRFDKNGAAASNRVQVTEPAGGNPDGLHISAVLNLAAGDYVEVKAYQDSGGALNIGDASGRSLQCEMSAMLLFASGSGRRKVGAKARNTTTQSITNNSETQLVLASADYDTDGFFDNANDRMVVPAGLAGLYIVHGSVYFASNSTGYRGAQIRVNGTAVHMTRTNPNATTGHVDEVTALLDLNVGDLVTLYGFQNSGGSLDAGHASTAWAQSMLSLVRVGE